MHPLPMHSPMKNQQATSATMMVLTVASFTVACIKQIIRFNVFNQIMFAYTQTHTVSLSHPLFAPLSLSTPTHTDLSPLEGEGVSNKFAGSLDHGADLAGAGRGQLNL